MSAAGAAAAAGARPDAAWQRLGGGPLRLLMVDNYDSFTFNLVQYLGELGAETIVWRNDGFTLDDVQQLDPDGVVVSPGPGTPSQAGSSVTLIQRFSGRYPILGVCLGHQAIGQAFGAKVVRAPTIMHGKASSVRHDGSGPFEGLEPVITATRYHSLMVEEPPAELVVNAWADDPTGPVIMGLRHERHPTWGVQFHPESILTATGHAMLASFLRRCAATSGT